MVIASTAASVLRFRSENIARYLLKSDCLVLRSCASKSFTVCFAASGGAGSTELNGFASTCSLVVSHAILSQAMSHVSANYNPKNTSGASYNRIHADIVNPTTD